MNKVHYAVGNREAGRGIGPGGTNSMVEQEKKSRSGQDQASGMPAGYEYDTLMNLMRVSVSKHLRALYIGLGQ